MKFKLSKLFGRPSEPLPKLVFDHLPKCGGTSLSKELQALYKPNETFVIKGGAPNKYVQIFQEKTDQERLSYRLILGHLANELFHLLPDDFVKITMMRDPVDRVVSHYFYVLRSPSHYLYNAVTTQKMSLADYIKSGVSDELENWYVQHFSGWSLGEIRKNPSQAYQLALEALLAYDTVGILEYQEVFRSQVYKLLNKQLPKQAAKENVTDDRPELSDLSKELLAEIEHRNQLDVNLYHHFKNICLSQS